MDFMSAEANYEKYLRNCVSGISLPDGLEIGHKEESAPTEG